MQRRPLRSAPCPVIQRPGPGTWPWQGQGRWTSRLLIPHWAKEVTGPSSGSRAWWVQTLKQPPEERRASLGPGSGGSYWAVTAIILPPCAVSPAGLGTLDHRIVKAARGSGFSPGRVGGGEARGADRSELIHAEGAKCRPRAPLGPRPFTACGLLTYPLQPRAPCWLPIAK